MMTTKTLTTTAVTSMAKMALLTIIVKTTTMSMATTIQQPNRSKQLQK